MAFRLGIDLYDLATNGRTGWQVLLELDGTLNMFAPGDPRAFRMNLASS